MRKFLAVIIMLLFWLVFPVSYLWFTLEQTLLSADYYKIQLRREDAYANLLKSISDNLSGQSNLSALPGIQSEQVINLVQSAFTPEWLRHNVEQLLDGSVGLLKPNAQVGDLGRISLDFREPKAKLGPAITEMAMQSTARQELPPAEISDYFLKSIPDQINLLGAVNYALDPADPGLSEEERTELMLTAYQSSPDISGNKTLEDFNLQLQQVHYWLSILHLASLIGFAAAVALLILIGLLFITEPKSLVKWLGSALFTPGIIGLVMFIPLKLMFLNAEFLQPIIIQLAGLPAELAGINSLLTGLLQAVLGGFVNRLLIATSICTGLGLILWIIARFIPKRNLTKAI